MAAALFAKLTGLELFEARRLAGALIGLIGLATTWRLARLLGGPLAGLLALLLLATCPLFDGHMYINAKDAPFATAMIVLLFGIVRTIDEYPRPSRRTVVLLGVGLGVAFGSRILAAVFAPYLWRPEAAGALIWHLTTLIPRYEAGAPPWGLPRSPPPNRLSLHQRS